MVDLNQKARSGGHKRAIEAGLEAGAGSSASVGGRFAPGTSERVINTYFKDECARLLKDVPVHIVKKAWFTLAHTLLDPGARVIDAGCADGSMTYAMAALNPEIQVTGVDINPDTVKAAQKRYSLPNLTFRVGNIFEDIAPADSVDVIINSFVLHEIYSASHCSDSLIRKTLEAQYAALKETGFIIIRDHIEPPPNDYVLIEFNDNPGTGESVEDLSAADLLA